MGEWIVGAFINLCGSIAINFGTNLLKLGHNEREKLTMLDSGGSNSKLDMKPIIHFQTWRVGILFFALGNCLNFVSFGYAAQSLLAALGSVQFVSNIVFTYFFLNRTVSRKILLATAFIVLGNIFLVAFGNHQSPVFTPEQLVEKYSNLVFLFYCLILVSIVLVNHYVYRKGELLFSAYGLKLGPYWNLLLPLSYATVSGAVGSCSVLFAKSLSNLLRLTMARDYQFHSWFTYSMLLLFLSTAGFWMTRLNEGLALFDAILIVPMFQIAWTFFSICTGFVYFQEYQVFDVPRTLMFILGMSFVFVGISLLAPDESKGGEVKTVSSIVASTPTSATTEINRLVPEETEIKDFTSFKQAMTVRMKEIIGKAKNTCTLSLGFGDDTIGASSVFVMPMLSSRMTGFRGTALERAKHFPLRSSDWSKISMDEDDPEFHERKLLLTKNHRERSLFPILRMLKLTHLLGTS